MRTVFRSVVLSLAALSTASLTLYCSNSSMRPPFLGDSDASRIPNPTSGDGGDGGNGEAGGKCSIANFDAGMNTGSLDAGCSTLPLNGCFVSQVFVASSAPAPMGGTLVDGLYVLTEDRDYTGPNGQTGLTGQKQQITALLQGNTLQFTTLTEGQSPTHQAYTFTIGTPDGGTPNTLLDADLVCALPSFQVTRTLFTFTASGNTLRLGAANGSVENVFVKQ